MSSARATGLSGRPQSHEEVACGTKSAGKHRPLQIPLTGGSAEEGASPRHKGAFSVPTQLLTGVERKAGGSASTSLRNKGPGLEVPLLCPGISVSRQEILWPL